MTKAQEQLATFVAWVNASSQDEESPLGDKIVKGPHSVIVPQDLALPPGPSFAPEHLPLWIPSEQSIPELLPFTQAPPPGQDHTDSRLRHLVWSFQDRRFQGALLGLIDPEEPLQSVLDRQLPGLDLTLHLALFLPLWPVGAKTKTWVVTNLPILAN